MPQYSRVEFPILDVVPLRQAEPGMRLEKAAFDRHGRIIAEPGTELTVERIQQFRNLNVRKVVVTDTNVQWIPYEEAVSYSGQINILETRNFDEAAGAIIEDLQADQSVERLRRTALYLREQASQAGDAGGVAYLDDLINRSYELEEQIRDLTDRLELVEDESSRASIMEALEGKIREFDELIMEINAPEEIVRSTVEAVHEKEDIRSSLSDYVTENPDVLEAERDPAEPVSAEVDEQASDWSDSLNAMVHGDVLEGINRFVSEAQKRGITSEGLDRIKELKGDIEKQLAKKRTLQNHLSDFDLDLDERKTVTDALEGRQTLSRTELLTLPLSQQFATKSFELMQAELDSRYRLWDALDEVTGGELEDHLDKSSFLRSTRSTPPSSDDSTGSEDYPPGTLAEEELYDALDTLETVEDLSRGIRKVSDLLAKQPEAGPKTVSEFRLLAEKFESAHTRRDELMERVRETVEEPSVRETVLAVLRRENVFEPDDFFQMDAPMDLLEDVADFMTEYQNHFDHLWESLNEVSAQPLRDSREDSSENRVNEKIEAVTERLFVERSSSETESVTDIGAQQDSEDSVGLMDLIRNGEDYELANWAGLEVSTVNTARECLRSPRNLDSDQKFYCRPLIEEGQKLYFGRELDDETLRQAARELTDQLVDHTRPLSMLLEPPAGDQYLLVHGINTAMVGMTLADAFRFDEDELLDFTAASLSMDMGMIEIPTALWARDEELTRRADEEIKKHPEHSRSIAQGAVNGDDTILDIVVQHHERSDGSGYPDELAQDEQHELARVLGVCDAYVAMMEDRTYRKAKTPDVAMSTLLRNNEEFDQSVVRALVETIGIYPNGSVVLLSDARLALVKNQDPENPTKPTVLIISDREQNRLDDPVPADLNGEDASIQKIVKW